MKRVLIFTLTVLMLFSLSICPAFAAAEGMTGLSAVSVDPGNLRWDNPVYNYAWLDNMIIRDDAMAVTQARITPKPTDYPYSHTYDGFLEESGNYTELITLDEETVAASYNEIINAMYYLVVAMGMTDDVEAMKSYIAEKGIRLPANTTASDKAAIAVVYAAIKYDAVYTLYGKHVQFPVGTTLDGAVVTIISALSGAVVPSGVDNLTGFAVFCTKNYVTSFENLPISTNPSDAEIFHWAKVIVAASAGDYQVPVEVYSETSQAQKEYVDYAYYASILSEAYDVKIDPIRLIVAIQSTDPQAVQKLILQTMLKEKNVDFAGDEGCQQLFNMACENGCFMLEQEFYTDVLDYELEVAQSCEKVWFTAFPVADLLPGGSEEYITMTLNGTAVAPDATTGVALDTAKAEETVVLEVMYSAPDRQENAVYTFRIIKNAALNQNTESTQNDMVADVESFVNTIVPAENDKATAIVDGIFQSVDSAAQGSDSPSVGEGILTTYSSDLPATAVSGSQGTTAQTDRFDFDYLEELIDGVYEMDENGNIITTTAFDYNQYTTEEQSFVEKTVETVKENPEIVAAPTGIIAVGALAGYLMTKKHRDSESYLENSEKEDGTEYDGE